MRTRRLCFVLALVSLAGLGAAEAQQPPYGPSPYAQPQPPQPYRWHPYPAPGQQPAPVPFPFPFPDPQARDLMLRGAEQILRALELMIQTLPSYEPPVVTPDGDIIIRRHRGRAPLPPYPAPEPTSRPAPGGTVL